MKRKAVSAVLILLGICLTAFAGPLEVSLDEFVSLVLANNRDIEKSERSVRDAESELKGWLSLEDTRLDLSGSLRYLPPAVVEEARRAAEGQTGGETVDVTPIAAPTTLSGTLSVSVPIIPQVSMSGQMSSAGNGSVSLSLKPFATGIEDPAGVEVYRKAVLQLVDARSRTAYDAEEAGLSLLMREAEWELVWVPQLV